ncbi:MAG: ATP synthase F1 subunit gamma [Candidatus Izemoplasmatales bacterium]|nr:ATP synthase F1 subunit gamma [bacterium]MDZ4196704.1 ATP synthase F1 subunit gamma [Candidatus Izemoplasmatales bacterium]
MASMRDIKTKITATRKTSQITKAMNMVSASKLRKADKKYKTFHPLVMKVKGIVENILSTDPDIQHPLLTPREIKKTGYILITSDRGLAGPYNTNVLKTFHKITSQHASKDEYFVGTIGFKGYSYCKRSKHPLINEESINSRDEVQFIDFQAMARTFIQFYIDGVVDKIVVIHSHFVNTITHQVQETTILPITDLMKDSSKRINDYLYEPSADVILSELLPIYVENTLYGIILDAKASEHASRMTAMKNASDNAKEVITTLNLYYNRARQGSITKELTDIIGGANAVS